MQTVRFRAMNTDIVLAAEGKAELLAQGFRQAEAFVHAGEARFSRFQGTSELSALNRSAGSRFHASEALFSVISLARRFFHITRGLFDPSILPNLKRAGYDRSMDLVRSDGSGPLLEYMLSQERPSFSELELDDETREIFLPSGMELDLGGIAKGWIAEQAVEVLSRYADVCGVNAGGDMFLSGKPEGLPGWQVDLEDPFQPENTLTSFAVEGGGVATSTVLKRTWKQGALERHHLIDPRTGEPALTAWVSVTVLAGHAYEAEVFAKALLIGGEAESQEISRASGIPFSFLAVDRYGKLWGAQKITENVYVHQ